MRKIKTAEDATNFIQNAKYSVTAAAIINDSEVIVADLIECKNDRLLMLSLWAKKTSYEMFVNLDGVVDDEELATLTEKYSDTIYVKAETIDTSFVKIREEAISIITNLIKS